jgi:uncharacterized RDD family membrane protein YckC
MGGGIRGAGRVAEATGIDQALEDAAEAAVVRALAGPAAERALSRALESEAVERSLVQVLDSEMVERVWERLLASDEAQKLVERIAQAPEVRQAIAYQGVGLIDDIGAQIGRIARRLDDAIERVFRAILRIPRRVGHSGQAGLVSRALATAIDVGILNLIFLAASALIGSAASAALGVGGDISLEAALAATGVWIAAASVYLLAFWSLSGETPGMRFLDIRLQGPDGPRIGLPRAVRRLLGLAMSALLLGLGFLIALWDERRRTLADRIARTDVAYLPPRREAPWAGGPTEPV